GCRRELSEARAGARRNDRDERRPDRRTAAVAAMMASFVSSAAARLIPSVVAIVDGAERGSGGAGIAWGASGLIVTNAHVATHRDVTVVAAGGRRGRGAGWGRGVGRGLGGGGGRGRAA